MTTDATVAEPTHHITLFETGGSTRGLVLCDAKGLADHRQITKTPIRRMPLRMTQGDSEWSDFELPYQSVGQDDWSGGIGLLDSEDKTRYWHGQNINTMHRGKLFIGPQPHFTDGYRVQEHDLYSTAMGYRGLYVAVEMEAIQIIPTANITPTRVEVIIRKVGTPNGSLNVEIWTDDGSDDPNAIIAGASGTLSTAETSWAETYAISLGTPPALTASTKYWLVLYGDTSDDATNHWEFVYGATAGIGRQSNDIASPVWTSSTFTIHYRLTEAQDDMIARLFEYKGQMYFVSREDDGGTPQLYINGTRGQATGTQGSTIVEHTAKAWTVDAEIGNIVVLVGGTGIGQWRKIIDNDADTLTVSPAWETTPVTADTEYVILGSNTWTEIGSTGLAGPVTDVLVVKDVVYFCQGEATAIRRFQYDANTNSFADDNTNKATFMELVHESAGPKVYKANNAAVSVTVASAAPEVWGTDLAFGTAIACGNSDVPITGLDRYFDPEYLMVLKQNQVGRVVWTEYQTMPLREMIAAKSENTGHASTVGGVYLYVSMMRGLERYYQGRLDDVGPNLDDGLPAAYQGTITYTFSYPGRIYIAVAGADQSTSNYSSVLVQNGLGWHPIYRSRLAGEKIRYMHHQVIPGSNLDKLWISEGSDVVWLSMPSETLDPTKDSNYEFHYFGVYESSWYYLNLRDIPKTFNEVNIWAESISGQTLIGVEYKIDEDVNWTHIGESWGVTPSESFSISGSGSQKQGRRIKFRLIFLSIGGANTPVMTAHVLEAVAHLPTKFRYSVQFRTGDENIDLRGDEESYAIGTFIAALNTWANDGTLLTMRHHNEDGPMDNKNVFITAPTINPISNIDDENLASYLCTMEIIEA